MYCGDGINDLVALAAADVGMAVGASHASAAASLSDQHASVKGTIPGHLPEVGVRGGGARKWGGRLGWQCSCRHCEPCNAGCASDASVERISSRKVWGEGGKGAGGW